MAKNTTKQEYMTDKHTKRKKKNQSCDERILSRNVCVRTEYAVRRSRNAVRTQSERSRYAPGLQVKSAATQAVTPGMPFTSGSSSPTTHNALPDRTLPPPSPQPSTTPRATQRPRYAFQHSFVPMIV